MLSTSSWLDLSLCLHHPPSAAQGRTSLPRPRVSLCVSFAVCLSIGLSMSLHHRGRDHDHQPRHASETAVRVPSLLLPPFLPPPLPLCIAVCLPACHYVCPCTYLARVRARGPAWRGARRRSPSQRARRVARLPQPPPAPPQRDCRAESFSLQTVLLCQLDLQSIHTHRDNIPRLSPVMNW